MDGAKEFENAMNELPVALPAPANQGTVNQEPVNQKPVTMEPVNREIDFILRAPNAREIHLVGDFNHWKINEDSRLNRLEDGKWIKKLGLEPGKYRYKFVVDGEWTTDQENKDKEQNAFGTFDSIIKL